MKTYDLYAESGPKMMKTVVHVPALLGCVFGGDTTQAALDAAPDAIRAYLRFLARAGERVDAKAAFKTRLAEHDTSGGFLGSAFLPTDHEPLPKHGSDALMKRLDALHGELRRITGKLAPKQLDAKPARGRPIRQILHHVLAEGGYLRGVSGASRLQGDADKGRIDPLDALDQMFALEVERLRTMNDEERSSVIMRGQSPWTARRAVRNMLEHCWEHYVEIAVRLDKKP
jgi:predicted RNase H-like HicB family nuclease